MTCDWPKGWMYFSLPLLTWQRLSSSTVLVEFRDGDLSNEGFDGVKEYSLDVTLSTTFERVRHLFGVVMMGDSFVGGIDIIVDTRMMSFTFASLHLNDWVTEIGRCRGSERVRQCHLVVSSTVLSRILQFADNHRRLVYHDSVEAACRVCQVDPEVVI